MSQNTSGNDSPKRSFLKGALAMLGIATVASPVSTLAKNVISQEPEPEKKGLKVALNQNAVARGRR